MSLAEVISYAVVLLKRLQADPELFDAKLSPMRTKRNESLSLVQLCEALAGGWQLI